MLEQINLAVTVTATSGIVTALDTEDFKSCAFAMDLTALTGGTSPTVQLVIQTSPDNSPSTFITAAPQTALSAVGQSFDGTARSYLRYVRAKWVTTGTPATATASFFVQCKRG